MIATEIERRTGEVIIARCECNAEIVGVVAIGFLASEGGLAVAPAQVVCHCGRALALVEFDTGEFAIVIEETQHAT